MKEWTYGEGTAGNWVRLPCRPHLRGKMAVLAAGVSCGGEVGDYSVLLKGQQSRESREVLEV